MNKFWKTRVVSDESRTIYQALGTVGKDYSIKNAHEIETCYNYNGSGNAYMNGSTKWPVVNLTVAFQEGQEKERERFVAALQVFVADFFNPPVKEGIPLKDVPAWKEALELKRQEMLTWGRNH